MQSDTFAVDIETIPIVEDPDFTDAGHWTPFAIAVGHQSPARETEVDVLFREDHTVTAEGQLINDVVDWIADRTESSNRVILTYNGSTYDLPILKHRASRIDAVEPGVNAGERFDLLLDTSEHVDLFESMQDHEDYWPSLDDALDEFGIDADEPTWNGDIVTGADMPSMGLELITPGQNNDLRDTVHRYASSDVKPLFELHAKLQKMPEL